MGKQKKGKLFGHAEEIAAVQSAYREFELEEAADQGGVPRMRIHLRPPAAVRMLDDRPVTMVVTFVEAYPSQLPPLVDFRGLSGRFNADHLALLAKEMRAVCAERRSGERVVLRLLRVAKRWLARPDTAHYQVWPESRGQFLPSGFCPPKRPRAERPHGVQVLKVVAEGAYGKVLKCSGPSGLLAVKVFTTKNATLCQDMIREMALIPAAAAGCPYIAQFRGVHVSGGDVRLALDFHPTTLHDLEVHNETGTISLVRRVAWQVLRVCAHMRQLGVLHRDWKPLNVLWDSHRKAIKLIDFGMARIAAPTAEGQDTEHIFTHDYRPPEVALNCAQYGVEVDLWSALLVIFFAATGEHLFDTQENDTDLDLLARYHVRELGMPSAVDWPELETLPRWGQLRRRYAAAGSPPQAPRLEWKLLHHSLCRNAPKASRRATHKCITRTTTPWTRTSVPWRQLAAMLLSGLQLQPERRPTPEQLMRHCFFGSASRRAGLDPLSWPHPDAEGAESDGYETDPSGSDEEAAAEVGEEAPGPAENGLARRYAALCDVFPAVRKLPPAVWLDGLHLLDSYCYHLHSRTGWLPSLVDGRVAMFAACYLSYKVAEDRYKEEEEEEEDGGDADKAGGADAEVEPRGGSSESAAGQGGTQGSEPGITDADSGWSTCSSDDCSSEDAASAVSPEPVSPAQPQSPAEGHSGQPAGSPRHEAEAGESPRHGAAAPSTSRTGTRSRSRSAAPCPFREAAAQLGLQLGAAKELELRIVGTLGCVPVLVKGSPSELMRAAWRDGSLPEADRPLYGYLALLAAAVPGLCGKLTPDEAHRAIMLLLGGKGLRGDLALSKETAEAAQELRRVWKEDDVFAERLLTEAQHLRLLELCGG